MVTNESLALSAMLFGLFKELGRFRREIKLAAAARHLRPLGQCGLNLLQRLLRVAAGTRNQPGCQTFIVVEQDLEQMLRRELLVIFLSARDWADCTKPFARSVYRSKFISILHLPKPLRSSRSGRIMSLPGPAFGSLTLIDMGIPRPIRRLCGNSDAGLKMRDAF